MSGPRTLYLVRHAATGFERVFIGRRNVPLSDAGRRQAERLAIELRGVGADALFSGDLLRTRETAVALGESLGLTPTFLAGLRERDFGQWEGLNWDQIAARFPSEAKAYLNEWLRVVPPGAESVDQVHDRVQAVWGEISQAEWTCAIIVGHAGIHRMLIADFLGIPLTNLFRIGQDVASVSRITLVDDVPTVSELNRHLDSRAPATQQV